MNNFPLFPPQASTTAHQVDLLFAVLVLIAAFFSGLIFFCVTYFAIKYRKGSKASRANARTDYLPLELTWLIVPFFISLGIYAWASNLYMDMHVAPRKATVIYVVGKQWMWKIQHQQGNREINELHIPVGRPVRLVMTSEDVIHSFFIPAFRIKQDVLPGRYSTEWFQATTPGQYHFFCAQYCGTSHASMVGTVFAMEPAQYEQWLSGAPVGGQMSSTGAQLFQQFGCVTCHRGDNTGRGPALVGLFGKTVVLQDGRTVTANEEYLRESILTPAAKIVAGYKPQMPTFKNQVTPDQLSQLIEYIKSLGGPGAVATRSEK